MFTVNNLIIAFVAAGMVGIFVITYIMSRQHKKVNNLMQLNKDVPNLFLHKATQQKFDTIRSKLSQQPNALQESISQNFETLVTNFRNKTISINTYDKGLDDLLVRLNNQSKKKISV
jgi:putative heme iron utilization protein